MELSDHARLAQSLAAFLNTELGPNITANEKKTAMLACATIISSIITDYAVNERDAEIALEYLKNDMVKSVHEALKARGRH